PESVGTARRFPSGDQRGRVIRPLFKSSSCCVVMLSTTVAGSYRKKPLTDLIPLLRGGEVFFGYDDVAMIRIFLLMLSLILAGCQSAQEKQQSAPTDPHQGHAATSPTTPSPAAKLLDGMGNVNFPITTNSKDAQAFFNQ